MKQEECICPLSWSVHCTKYVHIKSTTVYAPRRNWDFPQPPTRRLVCPLPPVSGGRGTLAGEKRVGRVPIPTRGVHCGTLYMYVLCAIKVPFSLLTMLSQLKTRQLTKYCTMPTFKSTETYITNLKTSSNRNSTRVWKKPSQICNIEE